MARQLLLLLLGAVLCAAGSVTVLTDASFEHSTQAATGATTGDWLVHFHRGACSTCRNVDTALDKLAPAFARGQTRVQFARVDCSGDGKETCKRFDVTSYPTVLLLHQGRVHALKASPTEAALQAFAKGGWRDTPSSPVPPPPAWWAQLLGQLRARAEGLLAEYQVDRHMKDYQALLNSKPLPLILTFFGGFTLGALVLLFLYILCAGGPKPHAD
eukprot:comp22286_c0_seq1/m.33029 comp22286_c0_seq1/g.33029  ORF comp22286_c0_seq1/g.33029 comp22286_c0_seq1/m.33029 type:complete len:215 (-) comp22286_c0_seq1:187-831(-)